jgi:hypothetical protein
MSCPRLSSLIAKGQEILKHIHESYIFRSTLGYLVSQLEPFLSALEPLSEASLSEVQIRAFQRLQPLFNEFSGMLAHLSDSKWIQPALNWPIRLVHTDIDRFRDTVRDVLDVIGLSRTSFFQVDVQLDLKNRWADFHLLTAVLQSLAVQTT